MKKNAKIGIGLAVISVVSLAAVNPVFADVRPGYIETTGTVVSAYSVNKVEEKADEPKVDEIKIGNGIDETSIDSPDFEKSANFCKLSFDAKTVDQALPEAKPSDYEDADIRALAEEFAAKGFILTDCKEEATKHGSGTGGAMYVQATTHVSMRL